jgi:FkbM family methyltransferase
MFWLWIARLYAYFVWHMAKRRNVWLPGLGFLCRRIRHEHTFTVGGRKYLFYPPAASMYSTLIVGKYMEPETHLFFHRVIPHTPSKIGFVDVGAAIGEMIIDVAGYPNVDHVIGFDPDPDNIESCRRSGHVNGYAHINLHTKVVADRIKDVHFRLNRHRGMSGQILDHDDGTTQRVVATTLDHEVPDPKLPYLVLIDVEGAESLVLRGAPRFIAATNPLIIFEYITGRDHNLDEIVQLLGPQYSVYRLRDDGYLDQDMSHTWNCVAVHHDSVFHSICTPLTRC